MNLVNSFRFGAEYKVSLDGVDDYISFSNIGQNIHKYVAKIETGSGFDSATASMGLFNVFASARPYMLTGDNSVAISGETLTFFDLSGRTYTTDNFSSGIITLSIEWNGSNYVFYEDGVAKSMLSDGGHKPIESACDAFGVRDGGNYADFEVHSLEIHGSGGILHQWLLNEGSGTTLVDEIGNNDATLVGGTWVKI